MPADTLITVQAPLDTSQCSVSGSNRQTPFFTDPDGDTLTYSARARSLPDNVRLAPEIPFVRISGNELQVFLQGAAAYRAADAATGRTRVIIDVTGTDPHGASASTWFIAEVGVLLNGTSAPSLPAVASRRFAANAAIAPFVLPAATGGDVSVPVTGSAPIELPYAYAVTGLPAGLAFDAATRTVSGTPTEKGVFEVVYTADDADDAAAGKPSATATDKADTARRTFKVQVGVDPPKVHRVRIVSRPTLDADGDGTFDTYVAGDRIMVDVEFGVPRSAPGLGPDEPLKVGGDGDDVQLRLDMGGATRVLSNPELAHSGMSLRFTHTVRWDTGCPTPASGRICDTDTDGVWVQKGTGDRVLFIPEGSTATVTHGDTGVLADLTFAGLPTGGDPLHKVDGSKSHADVGPVPLGVGIGADGAVLTVWFDKRLDTSVDKEELRYAFAVQGAGGAGARGNAVHPGKVVVANGQLNPPHWAGRVSLTLGVPARRGDTVTVSYHGGLLRGRPADGGKLAPGFRDLAVDTSLMNGTASPQPVRATVSGRTLRVMFDRTLDTSSTPAGSRFEVDTHDGDGDRRTIAGTGTAAVDGTVVTVTLARPVRGGEDASVTYRKPDTAPLRGAGTGNPEVRAFRDFEAVRVHDAGGPAPLGGAVAQTGTGPARSKMALYFSEALDAASAPAAADFAVRRNTAAVTVSAVAVSGNSVVLTLDSLAPPGRAFTVAYTPGANPIRDASGNAAAAFSQTLSAAAGGAPALRTAAVDGNRIVLTYDKALDPASLPAAGAFALHHPLLSGERVEVTAHSVTAVAVEGRKAVLRLNAGDVPVLDEEAVHDAVHAELPQAGHGAAAGSRRRGRDPCGHGRHHLSRRDQRAGGLVRPGVVRQLAHRQRDRALEGAVRHERRAAAGVVLGDGVGRPGGGDGGGVFGRGRA